MKAIRCITLVLFVFLFCSGISAQCSVEAGPDNNVTREDSVQLSAEVISENPWNVLTLNATTSLNKVSFLTDSVGYALGSTSIYKTIDAGQTWTPLTVGTANSLLSIKFYNKNIGIAVGNSGTILKTINGGQTWQTLNSGVSVALRAICFLSESTIIVAGASGVVARSVDGGSTWSSVVLNSTQTYFDIKFLNSTKGLLCGTNSSIYKTVDGGNTWIQKETPVGPTINAISFATSKIVCAVGTGGRLLRTTDGGESWTRFVSDTIINNQFVPSFSSITIDGMSIQLTTLTSVNFTSNNVGYITGYLGSISEGFVMKSTDRGLTWSVIAKYPGYKIMSGSFLNSNFGYVGGSSGFLAKMGLTGTTVDHGTYSWYPTEGLTNPNIANPVASPSQTTTYYVSRTENNCVAQDVTTVYVNDLVVNDLPSKNITCEGAVKLDSVTTNYTGNRKLRYKWTPSVGLSNDTVPAPIASPKVTTNYTVSVTTPGGSTATGFVTVNVVPLTAEAGTTKFVVCGGSVKMDSVTTNYIGKAKLRYKWTPSTGLSSDTVPCPIVTVNSKITYTVTVTAASGCSASDNVGVSPVAVTVNAGNDIVTNCGVPVQLGIASTNYTGLAPLKYKWTPSTGLNNDTIANPIATASNKTYTLTVTTPSGCTASDNVAISLTQMAKPALSYVGVTKENKNVLVWTKPATGLISSFNIYKETNVTNTYALIGNLNFDGVGAFVDTNSNPDVQSNKYKICIIDGCGMESPMSDYHKTMHLSINKGVGKIWNLIWEPYEGFSVSTYNIYRGTNSSNIEIIGSLSGSNTQFSDYTAPTGYVYYQVEAISSAMAGVKQQVKTTSEVVSYSSRSNIATNSNGADGLFNLKDISDRLVITPNPATSSVKLVVDDLNANNMQVIIYNSVGQLVKSEGNINNAQLIDVSTMSAGLYLLVVKTESFTGLQKLLIQK